MAIPKVIHYCWVGGNPLTPLAKKCIKSWKKYCPDYEIIEWNESNYDFTKNEYMRQAYEAKKWGFVPDYARLDIIYEHGGIYLDTDVELLKPIDELLDNYAFAGFESSQGPGAVINMGSGFGAEPGNRIIKEILDSYDDLYFINSDGSLNMIASPTLNSEIFIKHGFEMNDRNQCIENFQVLASEYLCPMYWKDGAITKTKNTYSIHHYEASWYSPDEKEKLKQVRKQRAKKERKYYIKTLPNRIIKKILGTENYEKIKHLLKKQ